MTISLGDLQTFAISTLELPSTPYQNSNYSYDFKIMDWNMFKVEKGPDDISASTYLSFAYVYIPCPGVYYAIEYVRKNTAPFMTRYVINGEVVYLGYDLRAANIYYYFVT